MQIGKPVKFQRTCRMNYSIGVRLTWLTTVKSLIIQTVSSVLGSWEEPPNISLTAAKNAFLG